MNIPALIINGLIFLMVVWAIYQIVGGLFCNGKAKNNTQVKTPNVVDMIDDPSSPSELLKSGKYKSVSTDCKNGTVSAVMSNGTEVIIKKRGFING